jgi:hypothetical protein
VTDQKIMDIDYSAIPEPASGKPSTHTPPRHVFFGKKDPNTGQMEAEPVYVHLSYPKMLYKPNAAGRLAAIVVKDDVEHKAKIAEGFKESPADFGVVTAPSFEQHQAMKASDEASKAAAKVDAELEALAEAEAKDARIDELEARLAAVESGNTKSSKHKD